MSRIIRMKDLIKKIGLSRTSVYRLERDGHFVNRVRLGAGSVGYREEDVDAWIAARPSVVVQAS